MKFKYILILSALIGQILSLSAREVTSFNEGWLFKRGPFSQDPVKVAAQWNADWETVNLPHTWNAKDMQVKADAFYEGVGYYRKTQFFGNELKGKRVFLRFEGVGANTEVYVNGKLVGMHRGAYSAFAFEIGTALKLGAENEIMVKADNASRPDVIPVNHNLFGVYGGIYRPVWLIITEQNNKFFGYKKKTDYFKVPLSDILYFESHNRKIHIQMKDREDDFYGSMDDVYKMVKGHCYLFIHKSIIVNYRQIKKIFYEKVVMIDDTVLPISQSRRSAIRKMCMKIRKEEK